MKKLLILSVLSLTFSCTKDDVSEKEPVINDYLIKYEVESQLAEGGTREFPMFITYSNEKLKDSAIIVRNSRVWSHEMKIKTEVGTSIKLNGLTHGGNTNPIYAPTAVHVFVNTELKAEKTVDRLSEVSVTLSN